MSAEIHLNIDGSQAAIRLLQLTDSHLGAEVGERLLNLDTDESLAAVLALVAKEQPTVDVLLATGDIANHTSVSAYQRFQHLTKSVAEHTLWLPGNHDDPAIMAKALGNPTAKSAQVGNWLILMLDSTSRGEVGGSFSEQELVYLREQLEQAGSLHVLLCLHHHPIDIGCAWLDEQRLSNADDFFELVANFPQVRGILWGHIHQQVDTERNGVKLMATPSTCIQFAPGSEGFKLDHASPGYRWLNLHQDGRIESEVSRVTDVSFDINYEDSTGY